MAKQLTAEDIERALLDPGAVFDDPDAVVAAPLAHADKVAILRRWEFDARELQVADDEGMQGGERAGGVLQRVTDALRELGESPAHDRPPPTKHG
jgi:hypothetical protein